MRQLKQLKQLKPCGRFSKCSFRFLYTFLFAFVSMSHAATFKIEDQTVPSGATTVTVPIKVSDFTDTGAFQFTLSWDAAVLRFQNLDDFNHSTSPTELFFFGANNFNTDFVGAGNLLVSYEQILSADASIADHETIFSVTFDVIGGNGSSTAISFTDVPTSRKVASFGSNNNPSFVSQNGTVNFADDNTSPVITLTGAATLHHEAGYAFTDPGATATDNFDTAVTVITSGTVDVTIPGNYILIYNATDTSNNMATPVMRNVVVSDTTAPVITLAGLTTVNHEAGMAYTDAGATATDNLDATVTVITSGTVDVNTPGTYTLTYSAEDTAGNHVPLAPAAPLTRTVVVADTIAPVITLQGDPVITVGLGGSFTDPGASVMDSFDDSVAVTTSGSVDVNTLGSYALTYNAIDSAGNAAAPLLRTVHIVDLIAPVISLNGEDTLEHEVGTLYTDAGATALDNVDTTVSVTTSGTVDEAVPGSYTLTYTASDASGNAATAVTRTVVVVDTTPPVITLIGSSEVLHEAATVYVDQGASAVDLLDGELIVTLTGEVDPDVLGTYTLVYKVMDAAGNAATPLTRNVAVVDTTPPVITLLGSAEMNVLFNNTFTDPGVEVSDTFENGLTALVTGSVDVGEVGTYILRYNVSDSLGNVASEVIRTVNVVDQAGPVITLKGAAMVNHEAGTDYVEAGATATDNVDTTVTVNIAGTVDVATPATYILTYSAFDSEGNPANLVTRTVVVADTIAPVITLLGDAVMTIGIGGNFTDPGASVNDSFEGQLSADITGTVDANTQGSYTLIYYVIDSSGNTAVPVIRTVHVVDLTPPVIMLLGEGTFEHEAGTVYTDAGATALDNVDSTVSVTSSGTVDEAVPGSYTLTYTASDAVGNAATDVTRTVVVADTTPPIIILLGDADVNHEAGTAYTDAGATVTDSFDTTVSVTTSGTVDEAVPGSYTLTYTASDAAGNAATAATRTVVVVDTTPPVITLLGDATMTIGVGSSFTDPGANV
ncbi:DUF5011 domain-containing protein, partial [Verrucomicrobia bacterium]|nr:DUF5011 domain-containing protein [Verrucomicrobiota bacterium]